MCCPVWVVLLLIGALNANALRIRGQWDLNKQSMLIVTKFAVQPIERPFEDFTRGFIFGNVTNAGANKPTGNLGLLAIPETRIRSFEHDGIWELNCTSLLKNISSILFEPRCFKPSKGGWHRSDLLRWVSCPENGYCVDETQPSKLVKGSQFTLRIDEPVIPEYWSLIFVKCHLDANCSWVETRRTDVLNYDIKLTNGNPSFNVDVLTKEFSFEEQNILEIMLLALASFSMLALMQWRGSRKSKLRSPPLRTKLLYAAMGLEVGGLLIQSLNMLRFVATGNAFDTISFISEFLRNGSECVISLILLLLGSGWSLQKTGARLVGHTVFYVWTAISILHLIFFSYGYLFIDDQRNYSDLLMLKTAKELIFLRLLQGAWFLIESKKTISAETNTNRAFFLLHFSAAFMGWFTYYILLVAVSLVVSEFYRLKFVIATTLFAKFIAVSVLAHIFWPSSSYNRFFSSDLMMHRTFSNTSSAGDSEEFDLLMAATTDDDEPDHPFK